MIKNSPTTKTQSQIYSRPINFCSAAFSISLLLRSVFIFYVSLPLPLTTSIGTALCEHSLHEEYLLMDQAPVLPTPSALSTQHCDVLLSYLSNSRYNNSLLYMKETAADQLEDVRVKTFPL